LENVPSFNSFPDFRRKNRRSRKYYNTGIETAGCSRTNLFESFALEIETTKPTSESESIDIINIAKPLAQTLYLVSTGDQLQMNEAIALREYAVSLSQSVKGNESLKQQLQMQLEKMRLGMKAARAQMR